MHLAAGARRARRRLWLLFDGWIGGGDAKLAAATALWFGFGHLLNYLLYASLFGGALTLLLLQFRQWPLPGVLAGQPWLLKLHAKESGIPYGIALAIGALMIYPETGMDQGGRPRPLRRPLTRAIGKLPLTRFRYASLTML